MALATNALTTFARMQVARPSLRSGVQAQVERLINSVSQAVENELLRPLGFARYDSGAPDLYQGSGRAGLFLRSYPVRAITSVAVDGQAVTDYAAPAPLLKEGLLWRVAGWPRKVQCFDDLTRDPNPEAAEYSIAVVYDGGYILPQFDGVVDATNNPDGLDTDIPADLEDAVIQSVLWCFDGKPEPGLRVERTPGGWHQEWDTSGGGGNLRYLRPDTMEVISAYKFRWW